MNSVRNTGFALATAAASLFAVACSGSPGGSAGKVHCESSSSCKGQGSCKSASNACKGQNTCKGTAPTEQTSDAACKEAQEAVKKS